MKKLIMSGKEGVVLRNSKLASGSALWMSVEKVGSGGATKVSYTAQSYSYKGQVGRQWIGTDCLHVTAPALLSGPCRCLQLPLGGASTGSWGGGNASPSGSHRLRWCFSRHQEGCSLCSPHSLYHLQCPLSRGQTSGHICRSGTDDNTLGLTR